MKNKLFVYGTLLNKSVVKYLLGRVPSMTEAKLNGYKRMGVKSRLYPAIIPYDGEFVEGAIFEDCKDKEMYILV